MEKIANFAHREILPLESLGTSHDFPVNLWKKMGEEGLLGLYLPEEFGGQGGDEATLAKVAETLVSEGGNLGMGMSWFVHNAVAGWVLGNFANTEQKKRWLPELAKGEMTISMAVSEPGMGGSPKRLSTTADLMDGGYLLNGEKMYLTNGPIADLYIVFAVTGETERGRKRFGALVVENDREGLCQSESGAVDFLLPSPHGGIVLEDCFVPYENLLGAEGDAFNLISKPFRKVEDLLGIGLLIGGMKRQLNLVAGTLSNGPWEVSKDVTAALGEMTLDVETVELLTAPLLANFKEEISENSPSKGLLAARLQAGNFQTRFGDFLDQWKLTGDPELNLLTRDMSKLTGLGGGISAVHHTRLGQKLLNGTKQ
ncbi:MAG: acyl-CoA dehydrogenase family protein [Rhodospirillales bacterium]|nr:acyl-CoA dehydrogenase family protein [Rhodospirillales bacterium]